MGLTTLQLIGSNLLADFSGAALKLLGAFLFLLIGWLLGKVAGRAVLEVLKKLKADDYFKLGKKVRLSELFSLLVSWIIYLVFISAAIDFLRIAALSVFFASVLGFVEGLLGGIVILVVGYVVAGYVQKQVVATNVNYAEVLGQVIFFFTLVITVSMAFKIVGIPTQLLDGIILLLVGGIALGLAIALGFGLKDTVAKLAKKHA